MKILQLLKTLRIGGSCTYVQKLSAGLIARGHQVVVAAGDRLTQSEFETLGAECRLVNMTDLHFIPAARQLAEIIREEKIDVINAHHWTPGAAGYLAGKRTGTPFLLSVHGTRSAWERLLVFYWSPKVVVDSAASRENLIRQFRIPAERVIEVALGVNTVIFTPGEPPAALRAELALPPETPVILHVSRLNATKRHVALALAEAIPALEADAPGVTALIAGGGEREAEVAAAAERVNARLGRPMVRALGERTDIPELMRLADIVVGTASVGQETLACGKPLVAAGKFGYVGTVTPENFEQAYGVNFGDHAAALPVTPAALTEALRPLLRDPARRRELGAWGRRLLEERFSQERMVEQMEAIYAEMIRGGVNWGGAPG